MGDKRKYTTILTETGEMLNLRIVAELIADKMRRGEHLKSRD